MTDKVKNAVYKALDKEYHTISGSHKSDQDYFINHKEYVKWYKLRDRIEARILLLAGSTIDSSAEIINLTNDYIDSKLKQSKKQLRESSLDNVSNIILKSLDREYRTIERIVENNATLFIINGEERIKWFKLHVRIREQILLFIKDANSLYPSIPKFIHDYVNNKIKQSKKNIQESLPDKLIKRFDFQLNDLVHMWDSIYELNGDRMSPEGIEYHLMDYCINDMGLNYTQELESLINDYVTERTKPIYESVEKMLSNKVKDKFTKIFDREVKAEPLDLYSFKGNFHNKRGLVITLSDYIIERLGSDDNMIDIVIDFVRDYISTIKPWASDLNEETNNINRLEQYIYKKLIKKYKFTISGSSYTKNGWLLICAEKNSNVRWLNNTVIKNMEEEYGLPPKLIDKVLSDIEKTVYQKLNTAKGIGKFYVDLDVVNSHGLSIIGEGLLEKDEEEKNKLITYFDKKYPDGYDEHKFISKLLLKLVDIYGWAEKRGSTGIQLDQKEWDARKKFVIDYVNNRNKDNITEKILSNRLKDKITITNKKSSFYIGGENYNGFDIKIDYITVGAIAYNKENNEIEGIKINSKYRNNEIGRDVIKQLFKDNPNIDDVYIRSIPSAKKFWESIGADFTSPRSYNEDAGLWEGFLSRNMIINIIENVSDSGINRFVKKLSNQFIFDCERYKKTGLVGFRYKDKIYHNGELFEYIEERMINGEKSDLIYNEFWKIIKEKNKDCFNKSLNEQSYFDSSYFKSKDIENKMLNLLDNKFGNKITLKNWKIIFAEVMDFLYERIGKENQNRNDYINMTEFTSKFIYGKLESKFGPEWHKLRHI